MTNTKTYKDYRITTDGQYTRVEYHSRQTDAEYKKEHIKGIGMEIKFK